MIVMSQAITASGPAAAAMSSRIAALELAALGVEPLRDALAHLRGAALGRARPARAPATSGVSAPSTAAASPARASAG